MKTKKFLETMLLVVAVALGLQVFVFPGLESENFLVNVIALTVFFLLVVLVIFGGSLFDFHDKDGI